MNKKLKKLIALFLCFSLLVGCIPALAEETELPPEEEPVDEFEKVMDEEEIKERLERETGEDDAIQDEETEELPKEEVEEETVQLTDKEAVQADKKKLDLGFTLCVSRDLRFPAEGENGTKITWKSSNPAVISDEGKFTCPKKITNLTVTATISRGDYKEEKKFEITANNRTMYDVVKNYLDTMIEYGRDIGFYHEDDYKNSGFNNKAVDNVMTKVTGRSVAVTGGSGMFLSVLNRDTFEYPAFYIEEWPRTGFNSDERASGCVTSADIWLYEMCYELALLTGDKSYEQVADDALSFFLGHCTQINSGVAAWGKHTPYDPIIGGINVPNQYAETKSEIDSYSQYNEANDDQRHAICSPFFQQKFFELNAEEWEHHLLSYWNAGIADQNKFTFSRHIGLKGPTRTDGNYLQMFNPIATAFAWGWYKTGNPEFKEALNSMMSWLERATATNHTFQYPQEIFSNTNRIRDVWSGYGLVGTTALYSIINLVPDDIGERIRKFLKDNERVMDYDPSKGQNSFATFVALRTGIPDDYRTLTETGGYWKYWGVLPKDEPIEAKLNEWCLDWVDKYMFGSLESRLSQTEIMPSSINTEILILRTAYSKTGDYKYLDRMLELADFSIYAFWQLDTLLPSMSYAQKKYYESVWGSAKLAKMIWDVHFLDVERKTGVNPQLKAWNDAGYPAQNITDVTIHNREYYQKTKYGQREVEVDEK